MKRLLNIILILFYVQFSFAQYKIIDLKTGDTMILNNSFLENIQIINPDFFYMENVDILFKNLSKTYLLKKIISEEASNQNILSDTAIQKQYEDFMIKSHENFLFNVFYRVKIKELTENVDEDQIKSFYENNKELFAIPCTYSFWQLWITDVNIKEKVLSTFKKLVEQNPESKDFISKSADTGYAINIERDIQISPDNDLFPLLKDAKENKITGPLKLKNREVYIYLLSKKGCGYKPYMEVRNDCKNMLVNKKINDYNDSIQSAIIKRYIITGTFSNTVK